MPFQRHIIRRGSCRSGPFSLCSHVGWAFQHPRRLHGTQPTPWQSEDRVANWCCRLWGLREGCWGDSPSLPSPASMPSRTSPHRGLGRELLSEVECQIKLADELKAVMIGEKGRLPESLVESVWDIYESIIPPDVATDIARYVTPTQEIKFFEFIGLLAELDINLADVKAATEKLTRCVGVIETLHTDVKRGEERGGEQKDSASSSEFASDAAMLSAKLVTAKNELLRQCVAVSQAGSPVHYLWLRQSASLERGMKRLMDLRRCVTYFKSRCRERLAALQADRKQEGQQLSAPVTVAARRENMDLWIARQRHVSSIDGALEFLFSDFFAKEWLVMEELTWHSTPPLLLEKVIAAEAVHPFFIGLADMKQRLQPTKNRHLFAFFHPAVVEEPLIAVQVALTRGIAGSVDRILGRPSPLDNPQRELGDACTHDTRGCNDGSCSDGVDTAIFYSINSANSALRGFNLGNLLIKRVVREIEARLNAERRAEGLSLITTFSTLSPIPGYIPWLTTQVAKLQQEVLECRDGSSAGDLKFLNHRIFGDSKDDEVCLFSQLREAVLQFVSRHPDTHADLAAHLLPQCSNCATGVANLFTMRFLLRLFQMPDVDTNSHHHHHHYHPAWWEDSDLTRAIELPLLRSVAHYLYKEKRRGRILDQVGNFHISNGATMWRLNYLGNCSVAGSRESATVMVNYLYDPARVSEQVNAYEVQRTVSVGEKVLQHLGTI
ncbi:putative malonyl-CoA decarboxylase, mitochondrial precursor [Trypanosoma cruzi]|nr:putative malonyl-CoA decarboxylase, mitochondrial precursor [Trypanosoma cruzi]